MPMFFLMNRYLPNCFEFSTKMYVLFSTDTLHTLNLFYEQRPVSETSHPISKFDSGCLAVAYFGGKIG